MIITDYYGRAVISSKQFGLSDPWEPLSFSVKPVLWLRADSIIQADNTAVSCWQSRGGTSIAAIQGLSARQPTYHVGPPAYVSFDGTDDMLSLGHALDNYIIGLSNVKYTTFAVVQTSVDDHQTIWSKREDLYTGGDPETSNGRGPQVILYRPGASGTGVRAFMASDCKSGFSNPPTNTTVASLNFYGDTRIDGASKNIISARYDLTAGVNTDQEKIWVNGVAQTYTWIHSDGTGQSDNRDSSFWVGSALFGDGVLDPHNMLNGKLYELLLYPNALSDTDRGTVESYLTAKYP